MPKTRFKKEGVLLDTWGRRNRALPNRNCNECDKEYRPRCSTSKYCSVKCARKKNGGHNKKKESWYKNKRGYIEVAVWVDDYTKVCVKQHRYFMEIHLGRKLLPTEDVHHINGIKDDNRIENLMVIGHAEHSSLTSKKRISAKGRKINISPEESQRRSKVIKEYWQKRRDLKNQTALK